MYGVFKLDAGRRPRGRPQGFRIVIWRMGGTGWDLKYIGSPPYRDPAKDPVNLSSLVITQWL